ncbi:MAG: hypothetical protein EOM21_18550 [Gammaproteobacteria bacterium]|nr:hypothetical protein [Gammaproteobacteria bacterium]
MKNESAFAERKREMKDKLKLTSNSIWRGTGFRIKQEGDLFLFEDLNLHVWFQTVLSRADRIKVIFFLVRSLLRSSQP